MYRHSLHPIYWRWRGANHDSQYLSEPRVVGVGNWAERVPGFFRHDFNVECADGNSDGHRLRVGQNAISNMDSWLAHFSLPLRLGGLRCIQFAFSLRIRNVQFGHQIIVAARIGVTISCLLAI